MAKRQVKDTRGKVGLIERTFQYPETQDTALWMGAAHDTFAALHDGKEVPDIEVWRWMLLCISEREVANHLLGTKHETYRELLRHERGI